MSWSKIVADIIVELIFDAIFFYFTRKRTRQTRHPIFIPMPTPKE